MRRVCTVCTKAAARYTCPRCHTVYCSSACYKDHSSTCSEAFYREQATAQLKATKAGPEETLHMMEVLQRLHQQQLHEGEEEEESCSGKSTSDDDSSSDGSSEAEADEEEGGPSQRRQPARVSRALRQLLKRAQREGAESFDIRPSDLTPEVLQALEGLRLSGQLAHLVTPWDPWWECDAAAELQLNAAGQRVVQDMQELQQQVQLVQQVSSAQPSSKPAAAPTGRLPSPPDVPLPRLQELAGQAHKPSPLVPWQLLQLLVAYCAVMRLFNGEPEAEGGWEAAHQLLQLAPPLLQAALLPAAGSSGRAWGTSGKAPAAGSVERLWPKQQDAQQQQQQHTAASTIIQPPDSVRGACIQLLDAAAAAHADLDLQQAPLEQQLAALAAAVSGGGGGRTVSAEHRALLQVALADALKLLVLGRSAAVLALTDARRQLQGTSDRISQHLQQQQQQAPAATGELSQQRQRYQLQKLRHYLRLALYKLWYLAVWTNEQRAGLFERLADELRRELQAQQAMMGQQPATDTISLTASGLGRRVGGGARTSERVVVVEEVVGGGDGATAARGHECVPAAAVQPPGGGGSITGLYELD